MTLSAALLAVLAPVFLIVAAIVWLNLGTPVLFRQERPGRLGKPFRILKFRTMRDKRRPDGSFLPDEQRLTTVGRFLRSSSLDELPELLNVLSGDMSLVGPRPLLMEYLDIYTPEQAKRHDVRPGVTGWAQVNGRNDLSWEEKFALDTWYVNHQSFFLDLGILFLTVWRVITRDGISQPGHATAAKFTVEREG